MSTSMRVIVEYYSTETGEVIESQEVRNDKIKKPTTIDDLGYSHQDQINLLESILNRKLGYETILLNKDMDCPKCGRKTKSNGFQQSDFHAVLTDHRVKIQKRLCKCGWKSAATVDKIYGSSSHPDLIEKQIIQGSENSYRQASRQLNAESKMERSINNDDRIRRNISKLALIFEDKKLARTKELSQKKSAKRIISVIDGGHLKTQTQGSRSFEAMIATVYRPENLKRVDKNHNEITAKTSVASAMSDGQKIIKQLVINACIKEGSNSKVTEITCLTDGANNCWPIANALEPYCKTLINVLDWFHITKRFTIINNKINNTFKERLEKVKWFLWHGKPKEALSRLSRLQDDADESFLISLQELYDYIHRNQKYVVNYQERNTANLPYTSTVAESSVNELINTRQKNNKKMQWTRKGAHSILQIRTSRFSKTWNEDWKNARQFIYKEAA